MSFFEKSQKQKLAMFSHVGKGKGKVKTMLEARGNKGNMTEQNDDTQLEAGGETGTEDDALNEAGGTAGTEDDALVEMGGTAGTEDDALNEAGGTVGTEDDALVEAGGEGQPSGSSEPVPDETILESVCPSTMLNLNVPMAEDQAMLEAAQALSEQANRSDAMAAVQVWANESGGDIDDLDSLPYGLANIEGEGDMSDDEIERYEEASTFIGEAMIALGASEDDIYEAMVNGSQDSANNLVEAVTSAMDESAKTEDEIISSFGVADGAMYEQRKMVVRDGKKKWIKQPVRKKRMNAKQKASLRKARKKAHTGTAKRKRARSVKRRG